MQEQIVHIIGGNMIVIVENEEVFNDKYNSYKGDNILDMDFGAPFYCDWEEQPVHFFCILISNYIPFETTQLSFLVRFRKNNHKKGNCD